METVANNSLITKEDSKKYSLFFSGLDYACTAITSFILYWLFSKFTSDSFYFESTSCKRLLTTSQKMESFYYYLFFTYLILLVLNYISIYNKEIYKITEISKLFVLIFSFFLGLFYLLKLTKDINLGEPCGELRLLALIVAVIGWLGIAMFSCLLCSTMISMIGKKDEL